ncbi:MAG: DegT/DnrJ/EryC1/StrS family aminotransferase, partial [Candidatus Latescibacterota bacterium]
LTTSNYRLTEFQGALLQVQLGRLDEQTRVREENARYLGASLSQIEGVKLAHYEGRMTRLSWCMAHLKYDARHFEGLPKAKFLEAAHAEGIPLSTVYHPLHKLPLFAEGRFGASFTGEKDFGGVSCPVAERAYEEVGIWLVHDYGMLGGSRSGVDDIVTAIAKVKKHAGELL